MTASLPVQAWAHSGPPDASLIAPVTGARLRKPREAFWTSTWDERTGSGWTRWCDNENFRGPEHNIWLLTPAPDARLFTVDSYADLDRLHSRYGVDHHGVDGLDWPAIAADYDGVHLTDDGQWRTRLSQPYDLYGWDCGSTAWFRWAFTTVEHRGLWTAQIAVAS